MKYVFWWVEQISPEKYEQKTLSLEATTVEKAWIDFVERTKIDPKHVVVEVKNE